MFTSLLYGPRCEVFSAAKAEKTGADLMHCGVCGLLVGQTNNAELPSPFAKPACLAEPVKLLLDAALQAVGGWHI